MQCPSCKSQNPSDATRCHQCGGDFLQETVAISDWSRPGFQTSPIGHLTAGTVLGERYEIVTILGEGGMGAVYKARDLEVGNLVALKVIRPELANQQEILNRFKKELILARQITHKNIIRIFDLGQADGIKFITMEFVEGRDLHSLMKSGHKFTVAEQIGIIRQVCRALEAAHAEGVVHRDLKPHNIMVQEDGRVVVMDFGIARSMEATGGQTSTGALIGTPAYMSPEQAKGEKVDTRSDLFSLGVIFYELLTGKAPYESETLVGLLLKRIQERPVPPVERDKEIPVGLSDIVLKSLMVDPAQRYQTAAEIGRDLDAWQISPGTFHTGMAPVPQGTRIGITPEGHAIVTPGMAMMAESSTWKWVGISVALAIVAIAAVLYIIRSVAKPVGPHSTVTVLVADFTNHTGDPIFDGTLEPMLNVALEGATFVNAFNRGDARRLAARLPHPSDKLDEQSARLVAVSQGLGAVVTGSLSRRGDGYRLSVEALDAVSGNSIGNAEVSAASKDEVLRVIPKIAAPIRKALGDSTPESVQLSAEAGSFTAGSIEIVHLWSAGTDQQFAGKYEEALQSFSKAAELDPNFARAYSGMAAMASNLGRRQEAQKDIKLAMEHTDRMTERERYHTRALYYVLAGDNQKCVDEYSALVMQYPADNLAHNNLAACYVELRNMAKAAEEMKRAVEINPKGALQRVNLSLLASYAGDFQTGEQEARAAQELNPASVKSYYNLAYAQIGQGQTAQAADSYKKLETVSARGAALAAAGQAELAAYEGRFSEALRTLEKTAADAAQAKNAERAADAYAMLAHVQLSRGDGAAATAAAERALSNSQSVKIRFLVARTFAQHGKAAQAQKLSASLGAELQAEPQAYAKLIDGEIAVQARRFAEGIKLISDANTLLDTWIGRFDLGVAYLASGSLPQADSEFDRCIKRRGEALELFMDDMPTYSYLPAVYYQQGRTRETMKSNGFEEFYKSYLAIRGKSTEDPLLPEARRRARSN